MKKITISLLISLNLMYSYSQEYSDTIFISQEPKNLKELNSVFDDYNSIMHEINPIPKLIFSTNRFSNGNEFDLISYLFDLIPVKQKDNTYKTCFSIIADYSIDNGVDFVNTDCNEFGPYFTKFSTTHYMRGIDSTLFFITRDCGKNLDILYTKYNYDINHNPHIAKVRDFNSLDFINTPFDEGYISISLDLKNIYYCSNMNGDFDIYSVSDSLGGDAYEIITGVSKHHTKSISEINSNFDEKCPFIHRSDRMVFCSNREGGYGGYDLYYSVKKDNVWSIPLNFGDKINSKYDEFRPIIIEEEFMIFSSNKPSGLGGFDLYIVEIE